jgi:hypothetical protein
MPVQQQAAKIRLPKTGNPHPGFNSRHIKTCFQKHASLKSGNCPLIVLTQDPIPEISF